MSSGNCSNLRLSAKMNAPGFVQTHHIAIICADYSRSKAFYTELLGFPIIAETYRSERDSYKLDLQLPSGVQLELFSFPNSPARLSYPETCGLRHLAFTVNDFFETLAYLQRNGVAVEPARIDELTGCYYTFFADPDGLPIEIYARARAANADSAAEQQAPLAAAPRLA